MKISIVIPTLTKSLTEKCISSIIKFTNLDDIEIIVVYQGKEEWYIEKAHKCIKLIKFDEPLGPVKALNVGIKESKGEYIMLLNDDTAVLDSPKDYWINELLKPFENPKMAITGPFKMPPVLGTNGLNFTKDKIEYGFIVFFCAVIPRRIFDEIGILDETLLCGVDVDFCMRVKEKGYEIAQVPDEELSLGGKLAIGSFPFYHEGEGTVHNFYGEHWQKMLKTDVGILNKRYGKSEKKVSIIIPTMTRDLVLKCIKSIIKYTDLINIEIIVVANGVEEELKNDIKILQDEGIPIKLLWYDEALGPIIPYNIGIKESNAEFILLLNDDVEITESKYNTWIDSLIYPFFENNKIGCVGDEIYNVHYDKEPMNIDYSLVYFYCAMIPKRIFDELGLLDENLKCSVDLDFCLRLKQNGYLITKANYNGGFPIKHDGRVSIYKNYTEKEWRDIIENDNFIIGKRYSRISIIITVHGDRLDEVAKCIESVYKNTNLSNIEIVVIANAISKRVDDYLKSLDYIRYYFYEEALGAVGAINIGLERSTGLIKVMLNQDVVILNNDWLPILVEPFKDKNVGATGPLMRPIEDLEYNCLHGFCFALRDDVYKEVGPYDGNFNPGCFEDVDYSVRIQKAGYKLIQVPEGMVNEKMSKYGFEGAFPIFHEENHQNWMESDTFIKNKKYFYDKYKEEKFMNKDSKPLMEFNTNQNIRHAKVTAYISTKDRYLTTLPMAIASIATQTVKPDEFILIDDGEQKDLRNNDVYSCLFKMLEEVGIKWKVLFGQRKGQVANHQLVLTEAKNDIIWRLDDDNFAEGTVLESLLNKLLSDNKIGAVAGRSIIPGGSIPRSETSGMIDDLYTKPHIQWSEFSGSEEVDHLHNTFLFRKEAAKHGYHMGLSPVGHREETMFSYGIKLAGWKVIVMGNVNTWHLRQPHGGIRSFNDGKLWEHDEQIFRKWMEENSKPINDNTFFAVLDAGLGDHIDFLSLLPEIKSKYDDIILATCYPEVFENEPVKQISISEALAIKGNIDNYNIYKYLAEHKEEKLHIKEAFRKLYNI